MMKSIYGKLICGFLITIVFSFSVAGYVALRSNYDQIEDMAKNELNATSEYVAGILNILEDANVSNTMNQYAISSEVNITLFSPDYGYYQYGDGVGAYDFDAFVFYPLTMALKIPKPIKLTQFEYDLLNAYSYEGTNVPNSRLIDYDFLNDLKMRGHYKNVDMKMTFEDVLERAVIVND